MNRKQKEQEVVFWCDLLGPVYFDRIPRWQVAAYLRELAGRKITFPDGTQRRVSVSTLKRKLRCLRKGGFDTLMRKRRKDLGSIKSVPPEVLAAAIAAKKEQPKRSDTTLNAILEERYGVRVASSTLYRHLKQAGATRIKLGVSGKPVRKRWSMEHTHDMWLGDFSHGPYVMVNGTSVPTRLSAFLDVHSRYLVSGRYYLKEDFGVLSDTLLRAFAVHGLPLRLYVDNAKVYYARSLQAACWRLSIELWHRPPLDPPAGGLVERFFSTVQNQFESEVRAGAILTLQELNRYFNAWVDTTYHLTVNRETKQTPKERFEAGMQHLRKADMQAVCESFLQSEKRTVNKTFSDVRLHKRLYRVDSRLRGDRVEVRYDPFGDRQKVMVYSLRGEYLGMGKLHQRQEGEAPQEVSSPQPIQHNLLKIWKERQQRMHQSEGLDFSQAMTLKRWPFAAFATTMAELLGRKGGISSFTEDEHGILREIHDQHPLLTRTLLKRACARAEHKTIPAIIHELQELLTKEE